MEKLWRPWSYLPGAGHRITLYNLAKSAALSGCQSRWSWLIQRLAFVQLYIITKASVPGCTLDNWCPDGVVLRFGFTISLCWAILQFCFQCWSTKSGNNNDRGFVRKCGDNRKKDDPTAHKHCLGLALFCPGSIWVRGFLPLETFGFFINVFSCLGGKQWEDIRT